MSSEDLWERITRVIAEDDGRPSSPPPEIIAFNVRVERRLRNWKVGTLADFAKVSVSTVERVERGEAVSKESLDRVAEAFGHSAGYFTDVRTPRPLDEVTDGVVEQFGNLAVVPVRPLETQSDVRRLATCQSVMINAPGVPEKYADEIFGLGEWIDFAGFMLSQNVNNGTMSEGRRREIYDDVLKAVADLRRQGLTVLSGVLDAPQPNFVDWKVAVISVSQKTTDPGAPGRKNLLVDRRVIPKTDAYLWCEQALT